MINFKKLVTNKIKVRRKIISIAITLIFLLTNTGYSAALRVPIDLQETKERQNLVQIEAFERKIPVSIVDIECSKEIKLSERFGEHYGALVPTKWMYHEDPVEKLIEGNYWDVSPITAQLVPTLNCTHRCYFCTYGGAKGSLKKGDTRAVADTSKLRIKQKSMPFDLMKKTIDELSAAGVNGVIFTGGGEPTLYPYLAESMRYCKEKGLDVSLNTNGFSLRSQLIDDLLDANPTYIRVSFNAGTPEVEKLTTGADDFERILKNIKLLAIKKLQRNSPVDISIGYVVNVLNVNDIMNLARRLRQIEKEIETEYGWKGGFYSLQIRPVGNYESSKHFDDRNIRTIAEYLRNKFDESYAEEFLDFMYKDKQVSARTMTLAIDIIENQLIPFLRDQGSSIEVIYPKRKFIDLPLTKKKPYERCLVCPWSLFIWPDGTAYHCVEWAGTPGFEIGDLSKQNLNDILKSSRRKEVLKYFQTILSTRCAPICAHHEMNILLNEISRIDPQSIRERVRGYIEQNPVPKHVNFFSPDSVIAIPVELTNFAPIDLTRIGILGRDELWFKTPEALSMLPPAYQEKFNKILRFVSKYIEGIPLYVDIVITLNMPYEDGKIPTDMPYETGRIPTMSYDRLSRTIYIHPILLTEAILLDYAYFVAHHDFIIHAYRKVLLRSLDLQLSEQFLIENPLIGDTVYRMSYSSITPVKPLMHILKREEDSFRDVTKEDVVVNYGFQKTQRTRL